MKDEAAPEATLHRYFAPLRNISLEGLDEVTLGPFTLRTIASSVVEPKVITDDFTAMWPDLEPLPGHVREKLYRPLTESLLYRMLIDAAAEIEYRSASEDHVVAMAQIEQFTDILRLFRFGGVTQRPGEVTDEMSHQLPGSTGRVSGSAVRGRPLPAYVLTFDDLPALKAHFENLYPFEDIGVAMSRFRSSYDRSDAVDAFIDLMICLEAIYSDEAGDTRYKLAIRASHFLGRAWPDRKKEFYNLVTAAYAKRSNLLHGRKKNDEEWVAKHYGEIWNLARLSLTWDVAFAHGMGAVIRGKQFDELFVIGDVISDYSDDPSETSDTDD